MVMQKACKWNQWRQEIPARLILNGKTLQPDTYPFLNQQVKAGATLSLVSADCLIGGSEQEKQELEMTDLNPD